MSSFLQYVKYYNTESETIQYWKPVNRIKPPDQQELWTYMTVLILKVEREVFVTIILISMSENLKDDSREDEAIF